MEKIIQLIRSSRYSIHDLSRCQARAAREHYRLNMPFELGVDFGCRSYDGKPFSGKVILILEEKPYQAAISDLAGNDIAAHGGNYRTAVRKVRNWIYGLRYRKCVQAASSMAYTLHRFGEMFNVVLMDKRYGRLA